MKLIISVAIFSILLGIISILKTQTRIVEKKIYKIDRKLASIKKDLHETQLDYSYLSSPGNLSNKIKNLNAIEYLPMDFSRIYLSYLDVKKAQKKPTTLKIKNDKKK